MILVARRSAFFLIVLFCGLFLIADQPTSIGFGPSVAQAEEKKRSFLQRLFGRRKPQIKEAPPSTNAGRRPKTRQSSKPTKKTTAALPKIDDSNRVVVIGDDTASAVALGLADIYRRTPAVEISSRTNVDLSIVGDDFYPWLDASDFTFLGQRVKAVVVALGTHDRADILENGLVFEFGTDAWKRAYRRRLVDITAQLQLLNLPIIWVLPPPVINDENSDKAAFISSIQSDYFQPTTFRLVDVRDGFVNRQGQFRKVGANLSGARVALRRDNGIGFTKSGARKLAHYVSRQIDYILDEIVNQGLVLETANVPNGNAQQVVSLTRPPLLQNATLAGENGRATVFFRDKNARQFFVSGKPLAKQPGRIDDFSWPSALPPEGEGQGKQVSEAIKSR